ncbi:MAG: zinc-binding dehydrogenase [Phycisphaerae bacterium]|nr:zinc-binding dehydrogenase [Phycisphaerae bacterium]
MASKLVFSKPFTVAYEDLPIGEPAAGQMVARTVLSAISHGTELASYRGATPFMTRTMNEHRMFIDKGPDAPPFYPFRYAGYDNIGVVEKVGPGTEGVRVGDRVWSVAQHQTHALLTMGYEMAVLPESVPNESGVMVSLTGVAMVAVNDADIHLGDVAVVFGGGVVGQMAAQLCALRGARRVFMVDPIAERRKIAADTVGAIGVDPLADLPGLTIRRLNDGRPPDVIIECSGTTRALAQAVQATAVGGTVIAAGMYPDVHAHINLSEEFLHNRVTLKASMGVWGCPLRPDFWDRPRVIREVVNLIAAGKLNFRHFTSTTVPFTQAQRAYEMIDKDPQKYLKAMLSYE